MEKQGPSFVREHRSRLLVAVVVLVLALGATPEARAQEQRCTELGADCFCSEPMNTDQYRVYGGNPNFFGLDEPNTKRCPGSLGSGGGFIFYDPQGNPGSAGNDLYPVATGGLGLPAEVQWVWRNDSTGGISHATTHGTIMDDAAVKKVCWRYYVRYSDDYIGDETPTCNANKAHQANFNGRGPLLHADNMDHVGPNSQPKIRMDFFDRGNGYEVFLLSGGGSLRESDCSNEWCRAESCIDGNFDSGTDYYVWGEWVGVSSGKTYTFPRQYVGNGRDGGGMASPHINMYRQSDGSPGCLGHKWISHLIEARFGHRDPAAKIGASCEMEGTCGGGPPAAPQLLP
jgi:hypothetical protein